MVKEEQDPEREAKWERYADPLSLELPELDEPVSPAGRLEGSAHGQGRGVCMVEPTPVRHRGCSNQGQRHAVVGEEASDMAMEVRRLRSGAEEIRRHDHQQRKYDAYECAVKRVLWR